MSNAKVSTILLKYGEINNAKPEAGFTSYKVMQLTDSTRYIPGEVIDKTEVDYLCSNKLWKVTIK